MSKPIPVQLDAALLERIDRMSEKLGEAKSTVMRMAMRIGLKKLESGLSEESERTVYPAHRDELTAIEDKPRKEK